MANAEEVSVRVDGTEAIADIRKEVALEIMDGASKTHVMITMEDAEAALGIVALARELVGEIDKAGILGQVKQERLQEYAQKLKPLIARGQ